jgi:nardilysin
MLFLFYFQVLRLWHLQDRTFKRPIAELRLQLNCAEANKTPLHGACADLLVRLVSDSLTETAYMASVCEIGSSLTSSDVGFVMRVHGFNDKLLKLFLILLERMMEFRGRTEPTLPEAIKDGRFDLCLETYRRACINMGIKASNLSSSARVRGLRPTTWSANQKVSTWHAMVLLNICVLIAQFHNLSLSAQSH